MAYRPLSAIRERGREPWRLSSAKNKSEAWRLGGTGGSAAQPPASATATGATELDFRRAAFAAFVRAKGLPATDADVLLARWRGGGAAREERR